MAALESRQTVRTLHRRSTQCLTPRNRNATLTTRRAEHARGPNGGIAIIRSKSRLLFNQSLSLFWRKWSRYRVARKETHFLRLSKTFICNPTSSLHLKFALISRLSGLHGQLYQLLPVSIRLSLPVVRNNVVRQTSSVPGISFRVRKRVGCSCFPVYVLLALVDRQEDYANASFDSRDREPVGRTIGRHINVNEPGYRLSGGQGSSITRIQPCLFQCKSVRLPVRVHAFPT